MLVQTGLNQLRAVFKVFQQVFLGRIDNFQLDVLAEIGAIDQQLQASPGRFQCLELLVVQDGIHLTAELGVDFSDHAINQGLFDGLLIVLRLQQLGDESRDATLGDVVGLVVRGEPGFGNNSVQNAAIGGVLGLLC